MVAEHQMSTLHLLYLYLVNSKHHPLQSSISPVRWLKHTAPRGEATAQDTWRSHIAYLAIRQHIWILDMFSQSTSRCHEPSSLASVQSQTLNLAEAGQVVTFGEDIGASLMPRL